MALNRIHSSRFVFAAVTAAAFTLGGAGCSRHTTSTPGKQNFNQENPDPTPTTVPTVTPAKPTPTPSATPVPTVSPKPPAETPIACLPDRLTFFQKLGVVSAGKIDANGLNVSDGLVGTTVTIRGGIYGYEYLGRGWDRYDIQATDLSIEDAVVDWGGVAYSNSRDNRNQGNEFFLLPKKGKFVDATPVFAGARALRDRLNQFPLEGVVTRNCAKNPCEVLLKGTHSKFNRFYLDPALVKKGDDITFSIPKGATAVVFLKGGVATILNDNYISGAPYETVWVAPDTTKRISLSWVTLNGTLLAPEADVQLDNALIMGRVIANSVTMPACSEDACVTVDSQEQVNDTGCL